jgi:FkbM family methyltransferase
MHIVDQYGKRINVKRIEAKEQQLAKKYIKNDDVVLELGARYGSVSVTINKILSCKTNQVVIEPDDRVWEALEINKKANNCDFTVVKGFLSNKKLGLTNLDDYLGGYGATFIENDDSNIPSFSLADVSKDLKFNVLVADCEGFLETFFDENPSFYDQLRMIIFEADYPDKCNYDKIRQTLTSKGFKKAYNDGHQNVYYK